MVRLYYKRLNRRYECMNIEADKRGSGTELFIDGAPSGEAELAGVRVRLTNGYARLDTPPIGSGIYEPKIYVDGACFPLEKIEFAQGIPTAAHKDDCFIRELAEICAENAANTTLLAEKLAALEKAVFGTKFF